MKESRWSAVACGCSLLIACGPSTNPATETAESGSSSVGGEPTAGDATAHGSTAVADSTGAPAVESWCLAGQTHVEFEEPVVVSAITDADDDGRDEIWVWQSQQRQTPETSHIRVYEVGEAGLLEPVLDVVRPGRLHTVTDIDGDGWGDVVVHVGREFEPGWYRGVAGFGLERMLRPISATAGAWAWADANADGLADYLATTPDELIVHLGDGAGNFVETDRMPYERLGSTQLFSTEVPGQLVVDHRQEILGFGTDLQFVYALEISAQGAIEVLTSSPALDVQIHYVGDLDGDDIPDVIGFNPIDNTSLTYLTSDGSDLYEVESSADLVGGMAVGPLIDPARIDVLHWETGAAQPWLRVRDRGQWPTPLMVEVQAPWHWSSTLRPFQADGTGAHELLEIDYTSGALRLHLAQLEPCE